MPQRWFGSGMALVVSCRVVWCHIVGGVAEGRFSVCGGACSSGQGRVVDFFIWSLVALGSRGLGCCSLRFDGFVVASRYVVCDITVLLFTLTCFISSVSRCIVDSSRSLRRFRHRFRRWPFRPRSHSRKPFQRQLININIHNPLSLPLFRAFGNKNNYPLAISNQNFVIEVRTKLLSRSRCRLFVAFLDQRRRLLDSQLNFLLRATTLN